MSEFIVLIVVFVLVSFQVLNVFSFFVLEKRLGYLDKEFEAIQVEMKKLKEDIGCQ